MDPDRQLDDFLTRIEPLSDAEKVPRLLGYFGALIESMDREQLVALCVRLEGRHRGMVEEMTILEVINGAIALRDLRPEWPTGVDSCLFTGL